LLRLLHKELEQQEGLIAELRQRIEELTRPFAEERKLSQRVAVGHSILVILYHPLKQRRQYVDLGANYLDQLDPQGLIRYHVKRLQSLGHSVTLSARPA
jgi:hypothetical protein